MRTRALVLASILPIALALAPSTARGQRDCGSRFASRSCSNAAEIAREIRQDAARWRAEARRTASLARAEARAFATAARAEARADARMWDRTTLRTRIRSLERMERQRDRLERRQFERRVREYRRWD